MPKLSATAKKLAEKLQKFVNKLFPTCNKKDWGFGGFSVLNT
jgi:hypothetical protein